MSDLLKINVNEHTERKNGLTYLSWAWAWAEVLKIDPAANWEPMYFGPDGDQRPYCVLPDGSMLVGIDLVIKDKRQECLLPVMDHRNKAIKNPDAFAVNTAMMRCLAKAIAMHGLGLYIYAGEDLPEGEEEKPAPKGAGHTLSEIGTAAMKDLDEDTAAFVRRVAAAVTGAMPDTAKALHLLEVAALDDSAKVACWSLLDSATRSGLKKAKDAA